MERGRDSETEKGGKIEMGGNKELVREKDRETVIKYYLSAAGAIYWTEFTDAAQKQQKREATEPQTERRRRRRKRR